MYYSLYYYHHWLCVRRVKLVVTKKKRGGGGGGGDGINFNIICYLLKLKSITMITELLFNSLPQSLLISPMIMLDYC